MLARVLRVRDILGVTPEWNHLPTANQCRRAGRAIGEDAHRAPVCTTGTRTETSRAIATGGVPGISEGRPAATRRAIAAVTLAASRLGGKVAGRRGEGVVSPLARTYALAALATSARTTRGVWSIAASTGRTGLASAPCRTRGGMRGTAGTRVRGRAILGTTVSSPGRLPPKGGTRHPASVGTRALALSTPDVWFPGVTRQEGKTNSEAKFYLVRGY